MGPGIDRVFGFGVTTVNLPSTQENGPEGDRLYVCGIVDVMTLSVDGDSPPIRRNFLSALVISNERELVALAAAYASLSLEIIIM